MNRIVQVKNQAELDAALEAGDIPEISRDGTFNISAAPTVRIASSQPRVEAYDSSQPRVVAWAYAQVSVAGKVVVKATPTNAILSDGAAAIEGGIVVVRPPVTTAEEWCHEYGARITDGVVVLFKCVDDNFRSGYGGDYTPGTIPIAADWDGGVKECGGGLHFCATPAVARGYNSTGTRFIACPVRLEDIFVHPRATSPSKVKAKGCAAPVWEVDDIGERVTAVPSEPLAEERA